MAYIGYDSRFRPKTRTLPRPEARPAPRKGSRPNWTSLAMIAGNILAWIGFIAAVRAIF